jgi:DNA-binding CsgD family transcriptional regulator
VAKKPDLDTYDAVIASIYDAAVEPNLWNAALERVAHAFSATTSTLLTFGLDTPSATFIASYNHMPECLDLYARHYVNLDVWNPGIAKLTTGKVATTEDLFPHDELLKTEFYNDFLTDFDVVYGLGGFVERSEGNAVMMGVQRGVRAGDYDREDAHRLELLYQHVRRALVIGRSFDTLTVREAALRETLDRLPTAILIVDRYARALIVNAAARKLIAQRDGLLDEPHGLRCGSTAATAVFRNEVIAASHGVVASGSGIVRLPRAGNARQLAARITPLGRLARERLGLGVPAAAVFIDDPDAAPRPTPELLREVFGLSGAEARLVALLASGDTLHSAADQLRVSRETLRTLLRRVFDKTGTRRQSELMALVARLTAMV